jgi:hypothetical protein
MRRLETLDFWPELLELKDELSLRELAARFGVTPGAISAALKRTGIPRTPAPPGPRAARKRRQATPSSGGPPEAPPPPRPGSKDHLINAHWNLLGEVPDADVAREAGVSVRTVASYRARHEIPGYSGPRRTSRAQRRRPSKIDAFAHLLGKVPDRVVAEEAGVSVNAVRNYRAKRGIPAASRDAAAPRPEPMPAEGTQAWKVVVRRAGEDVERVVLAEDIRAAVDRASAMDGTVVGVSWVGPLVDTLSG